MKKIIFSLVVLTLIFSLVACSKTTSQATDSESTTTLSTSAEILVGTFKLEGTGFAVTSDQARILLPLWQMLQSLSTSSTAATEEIQAVVDQINSTMTSDQMDAITEMKLSQQDMMTLLSQNMTSAPGAADSTPMALNGLPSDGSPPTGGMPSGGGSSDRGAPPSGGMPSGGSAPSGGFPAGGDTGTTSGSSGMSTTPQAVRSNGMADQLPSPLLNALIELLKQRAQS
jgi:hypothetical protein